MTRATIGSNLAGKIDNALAIIEAYEARTVEQIAVAMKGAIMKNFGSNVERLEAFASLPPSVQNAASRLAADMEEMTGRDETPAVLEAIIEETSR